MGLYNGDDDERTGGGVAEWTAPEINCSDRSLDAFIFYKHH